MITSGDEVGLFGPFEGLSEKQVQALLALTSTGTVQEAALKAGIGTTTIYRYLNDERFQHAYLRLRRQAVSQALAQLQTRSIEASDTIMDIANDDNQPGNVRLAAARAWLEFSAKGIELDDLAARVEEIERSLKQSDADKAVREIRRAAEQCHEGEQ